MLQDVGADIYKTWNEKQRREEIGKLVQGFQAGLSVAILCVMAESIAGSRAKAKKHLKAFMTLKERKAAVANVVDMSDIHTIASEFLL